METDGVLGMTRWLGCSLEALSPTNRRLGGPDCQLGVDRVGVIRMDTRSLHGAVDDLRQARAMSWESLADHLGVAASQLTRLSKGGRIEVRLLLTILDWLGRSSESFAHITDR
jgi:hypothetical protein